MGVTMKLDRAALVLAVVCLVLYAGLSVFHVIEGRTLQAVLLAAGAMCWAGSSYFQWKGNP